MTDVPEPGDNLAAAVFTESAASHCDSESEPRLGFRRESPASDSESRVAGIGLGLRPGWARR